MIIAVGFKVNNERAVQFRKWAGQKKMAQYKA
ncbi:MAG: virulence RhuM family protein [Fibrobacter sp.]|nr:virulence RhuM family protein [Fibrobacter sp.]MBR4006492.1 virulence RhuM family protein [Fibrobacter sp.]